LLHVEPFHVVEVITPVPETEMVWLDAPEVATVIEPDLAPVLEGEKRT